MLRPRSTLIPCRSLLHTFRIPQRPVHFQTYTSLLHRPPSISIFRIRGLRYYSSGRKSKTILNSIPAYTPKPILPKIAWRVGAVLFLLCLPGHIWVFALLGFVFYNLYKWFRRIKGISQIHGIPGAPLSTLLDGNSILDTLFARDKRTQEVASQMQEMAMERITLAAERNEAGIRKLLGLKPGDSTSEFHFTPPTEVSMVTAGAGNPFLLNAADFVFGIKIKFMASLTTEEGQRISEVTVNADVDDEGVKLKTVDVRDTRGGRRVRLEGMDDFVVMEEKPADSTGVGRGEGEGKTIDAEKWTSK